MRWKPGIGVSTRRSFRAERYAFDAEALKPYFEMNRVLQEGVFHFAGQLYGLRFEARPALPTYHPDVQVFEVFLDEAPLGLFLFDPYARPSKRGGASDERLRVAEPAARDPGRGGEPSEHREARPGAAHAAHLRRGEHHVPRVRPCLTWALLGRDLSPLLRHSRAPGFCGVPLSGSRDGGHLAEHFEELCRAP